MERWKECVRTQDTGIAHPNSTTGPVPLARLGFCGRHTHTRHAFDGCIDSSSCHAAHAQKQATCKPPEATIRLSDDEIKGDGNVKRIHLRVGWVLLWSRSFICWGVLVLGCCCVSLGQPSVSSISHTHAYHDPQPSHCGSSSSSSQSSAFSLARSFASVCRFGPRGAVVRRVEGGECGGLLLLLLLRLLSIWAS